jgi:hypothetical protein
MSKRLQVILPEADMRQIQYFAQADKLTVAEWVRRAIIAAQRAEPSGGAARKLGAVREAMRGSAGGRVAANPFAQAYPTADMPRLLGEIERGYRITAP